MPDESNRLTRDETNRRKFIRRCIESPKEPEFFGALKDALYSVEGIDLFDQIRILDGDGEEKSLFDRHLYEYAGAAKRSAYIAWCVEWVSRIARLTALAKALIPDVERQCERYPQIARAAILYSLDSYTGPGERGALLKWAEQRARRAEEHTATFLEWYDTPEYQKAVRAGVWDILRGCGNLGIDVQSEGSKDSESELARSLCLDSWRSIMGSMEELTQPSGKPIEARLWGKARFIVREWKAQRLRDRAKFITDAKYVRLADAQQLADEDEFTLSILTYAKGVSESEEDKEKRLSRDAKTANPAPRRHCVKCDAVLASWNRSEQSICVPCWQASQPDDYVRGEYAESGCALTV